MNQSTWNILLIDDDRDDFLLTRDALEETAAGKLRLQWAANYEDGMRALAENHLDAVLVDYRLGGEDGLDLIRDAIQAGYTLPFILLTGQNSYDLDLAAMQAGAVDYLPKAGLNPYLLERSLRYAIERQRLLEENRQQAVLFQTAFDINPDGLAIVSGDDLVFRVVNPAYRALTPHPEVDPLGRTIDEIWPPTEAFNGSEAARYIIANQEAVSADRFEFLYPDGTVRTLAFHLQPYFWKGRPAVLIVIWETTALEKARAQAERRAAEAEESRRILQAIIDYLPEGLLIADGPEGKLRMISQHALQQFGHSLEDVQGLPLERHPEKWQLFYSDGKTALPGETYPLARAVREGAVIENEEIVVNAVDHGKRTISCNAAPIRDAAGNITGGLLVWRDITQRKQYEAGLAYQARLLENVHDAILATDENFTLTAWNHAAEELYGWKAEEVLGRRMGEVVRSEVNQAAFQAALNSLTEKDYYRLEISQYTRQGKRIVVDGSTITLRDTEGRVTGYISANRDTTERFQAAQEREQLLRAVEQQQARMKAVIQNAPVGIIVADSQARILMTNPTGEQLIARPVPYGEDYSSHASLNIYYSDGQPCDPHDLPLTRSALNGERFENVEMLVVWPDGQRREWLVNSAPILSLVGSREGAVAIFQDITERRRTAEILQRNAAQMEAQHYLTRAREVERLNIAHDLHDGPLQEMIGISFRMSELLGISVDAEIAERVREMQKEMQGAINGMRTFCNELRPPALTPFGLERAIRSHADQFQQQHPDLALRLNLERDGQALPEAVRMTLFQVYRESLNNIIKHAQANEVRIHFSLQESTAVMEISDNGRGFQIPFHWVEFARQGHLGLVGIQERAEAVGGQMQLESTPGQGTNLRVTVPLQNFTEILTGESRSTV